MILERINEWVAEGSLSGTKHKVIEVKWIEMFWELDSESKLNRDPQFIQRMMAYGEDQAEAFLNKEPTGGVGGRTG
jgi:NTE family protein